MRANESTIRYPKGEPISVSDGVSVAIKDEIDCFSIPYYSIFKWGFLGGTKWLHKQRPCTDDAYCIKRLRLCGAMLVGKTNMHELSAGTSSINPHYGILRARRIYWMKVMKKKELGELEALLADFGVQPKESNDGQAQ
ncbi:hypothetical protein TSUD_217530 [Trifolium subterraneum]|uniref:Amidase domain-containing protein n=1 Tax=Trifolium subterraneum TaxID=3900 RepID=A0A2Z6MX59_TRISU|nr:hypothetical protein TSUD_217530 [Trifolium subterraneum]